MSNNFVFNTQSPVKNSIFNISNIGNRVVSGQISTTSVPLVFAQNWPTLGSSSANVRGVDGISPFELLVGGTGLSVVNASSEGISSGLPTTNALRVDLVYAGGDIQNMNTAEVALLNNAWTPPEVGGSTYFRVYKRFVYPHVSDPPALGNGNHCLEQYSGGGNSWSWTFHSAAGGFNPIFNIWVAGVAFRFILGGASPIYLNRNEWYRLEMAMHRTGTDLREHEIRIYNSSDVLVYDTDDFVMSGTPLTGYSAIYGTSGQSATGTWWMGTNGPHVVGATVGCAPAWYWAGAAVSLTDWCGPYSPNG